MCEPAKVKLEIEVTKDDMKAITADTVIFEETDGYVVMGFLQTYSPSKDEEAHIHAEHRSFRASPYHGSNLLA